MQLFPAILARFTKRHAATQIRILNSISRPRSFSINSTMSSNELPNITATPAPDQHILHEENEYTTIKEGLAHILIPASASKTPQTTPKGDNAPQSVFYNPIQQFNRDLSVLAIKAYGEQVMVRKTKSLEDKRRALNQKKKDKKRKRGEDGVNSDPPRKAGKLEAVPNSDVQAALDIVTESNEAAIEGEGQLAPVGEEPGAAAEKETSTTSAEPDTTIVDSEDKAEVQTGGTPHSQENTLKAPPKPKFTILDALSATGLRALRYAQEIPFTTSITANDLLPEATKSIELNVRHNKQEEKIKAVTGNALVHMYNLIGENCRDDNGRAIPSLKYDVIDLDPYGTAAPFLDAAVQSVRDDGGLLCVTCTDAGVWASNGYPEKSYSLYGGIPIKGAHSHEGGLRLILHAIATSAARYGLAIEPLLSLSIDFYARVFVRIHKSPADVKFLAGKTMIVYNCDSGCGAWTTQMVAKNKLTPNKSGQGHFWKHVFSAAISNETCDHCGMRTHIAGPMWAGPLHSPDFIKRVLASLPDVSKETYQTTTRIEGMLTLALEEMLPEPEDPNSPTNPSKTHKYDPATLDHFPFFFMPAYLSKIIHCITPHENALRGALRHLGYRVTRSHTKGGSIKTDAPWEVIWEIMREWVKQKAPVKEGAIKGNTAGWNIMGLGKKEESAVTGDNGVVNGEEDGKEKRKIEVVFDEQLGKEKDAKKLVRYQLNPRENWGPMNRAKGKA